MRHWKALISAASLAALAACSASSVLVTGAGSSFIYPVLSKWADAYHTKTGDQINYQSIGSGAGITQVKSGTVDFGATDKPLESSELSAADLIQFPTIVGGVIPVVNIPDVAPGQLRFTGELLADIYLGKITKWNDTKITALNPAVALPDATITVIHRSDGSGTTFNWTDYLSKESPDWKSKIDEGTAVVWPTGIGGKGNEGLAAMLGQMPNSIGYVEYAYVVQNHLSYALVRNKAGNDVAPSIESFQAAAASADWEHASDFYLVMTDAPGANAYPITATTFVLLPKHAKDKAKTKAALDFFKWALEQGALQAKALDYVPLPPTLVSQIETYWATQFAYK